MNCVFKLAIVLHPYRALYGLNDVFAHSRIHKRTVPCTANDIFSHLSVPFNGTGACTMGNVFVRSVLLSIRTGACTVSYDFVQSTLLFFNRTGPCTIRYVSAPSGVYCSTVQGPVQ